MSSPPSTASRYGIVYLLPDEVAAFHHLLYEQIEQRFGLTGRRLPPWPVHITLKYPFNAADISSVEELLSGFAASEAPVLWAIEGFGNFQDGTGRVVFMEVKPTAAVRAAHARLLSRLRTFDWIEWGRFDGPEMHYHATLAYRGLTPDNFEAVWQFVTSRPAPRSELALDNVTLVQVADDGVAATVTRWFDLTGAAA